MTIYYPDVSHYQAGLNLSGAAACVAKATEGTSFVDPAYAGFKGQAARLAIPFAAYHWLHAADVAGQAKHCFSVVGAGVPLMIDDEDPTDGLSVDRTLQFVRAYRALGGTVTLEYLPRWFWSNHGSPDLRPLAAAGLSLVSSNYTGYSDSGVGWLPYGGVAPKIWQYTSSQVFNGYKCDFNAFKGTVEQLRALFGLAPAPPYHEEDTVRPMLVRFADATDPAQIWYCDGQFRRRVASPWWSNGTGPITNVQIHQAGLLGNLATGPTGDGKPGHWDSTGTIFTSGGDQDVWGIDVATIGGGSGTHTHLLPAAETGPATG
jgi:hypothetical protein